MQGVSLAAQVGEDFARPGRVSRAFAVDAVKDVGHQSAQYIVQLHFHGVVIPTRSE